MIIDAITYNGERDLLKLRLEILNEHVDRFLICESKQTFSGKPKHLYFFRDQRMFKKWWDKIEYIIPSDTKYNERIKKMADESDLVTNDHYWRAFYQKEYIQTVLDGAQETDVVYYGDTDEIWQPFEADEPTKAEQFMYTYYLNLRTSEPWKGTVRATVKQVREIGLNNLRAKTTTSIKDKGWHFSNMGGLEALTRKIESYDHQEVNTEDVKSQLKQRIENKQDFLGRNYQLWEEKQNWPQFLKDNEYKYKHMIWQP